MTSKVKGDTNKLRVRRNAIARRRQPELDPEDAAPSGPPPTIAQTPGSTIGDAPVTITLTQLRSLESSLESERLQSVDLRRQLAEAKALDPTGLVGTLRDLARMQMTVIQFAIANLPPSEIPKWPYMPLESIVAWWPKMPDFNAVGDNDSVLVKELGLFIEEIKEHELARGRARADLIANAPADKLRPRVTLRSIEVGADGRCTCGGGTKCPLGRMGAEERCTTVELLKAGIACTPAGATGD